MRADSAESFHFFLGKVSGFCHLIGKLQSGKVRAGVKGNEWRVAERGVKTSYAYRPVPQAWQGSRPDQREASEAWEIMEHLLGLSLPPPPPLRPHGCTACSAIKNSTSSPEPVKTWRPTDQKFNLRTNVILRVGTPFWGQFLWDTSGLNNILKARPEGVVLIWRSLTCNRKEGSDLTLSSVPERCTHLCRLWEVAQGCVKNGGLETGSNDGSPFTCHMAHGFLRAGIANISKTAWFSWGTERDCWTSPWGTEPWRKSQVWVRPGLSFVFCPCIWVSYNPPVNKLLPGTMDYEPRRTSELTGWPPERD